MYRHPFGDDHLARVRSPFGPNNLAMDDEADDDFKQEKRDYRGASAGKSRYKQRIQQILKCPTSDLRMYDTDLSRKEVDLIKRLSRHTWLYEDDNSGRDARGLSHGHIRVTCIAKVNNPELYAKYVFKLSTMPDISLPRDLPYPIRTQTCRGYDRRILPYAEITGIDRDKEILLFHGTKPEKVHDIAKAGFKLRHAGAGMYGQRIYLTDCCQKADQYGDTIMVRSPRQAYAMFVIRTTLGRMRKYDANDSPSNYDSQIGGTAVDISKRFYEFMIPNEDQCYPAYVVIYQRT